MHQSARRRAKNSRAAAYHRPEYCEPRQRSRWHRRTKGIRQHLHTCLVSAIVLRTYQSRGAVTNASMDTYKRRRDTQRHRVEQPIWAFGDYGRNGYVEG